MKTVEAIKWLDCSQCDNGGKIASCSLEHVVKFDANSHER